MLAQRHTQTNGRERKASEVAFVCAVYKGFWQKFQNYSVGKGLFVFKTNGAGKTWYPHEKEGSWVLILHHIQKLTQNV